MISVALQDRTRSQQASEETQASPLRSDGGPQGEFLQRSFSPAASLGIATIPPPESRIESSGGLCTPQINSIAPQDRQRLQQTSKERWRTSRSASPTVTFGICSAGSRVEDSGELDRRRYRSAHPSGTSKRNLSPRSQVRYLFCFCKSQKKLKDLGNYCCCQVVGEGRSRRGREAHSTRIRLVQ